MDIIWTISKRIELATAEAKWAALLKGSFQSKETTHVEGYAIWRRIHFPTLELSALTGFTKKHYNELIESWPRACGKSHCLGGQRALLCLFKVEFSGIY